MMSSPSIGLVAGALPTGWSKQFSKSHQRFYWFNSLDGTRSWEPPSAAVQDEDSSEHPSKKRARTADPAPAHTSQAAASSLREDTAALTIERTRRLALCFDAFCAENTKHGEMAGNSKTSRSCRKDGMRLGLQGMFGRLIWSQLLRHIQASGDVGSDPRSDAVFVPAPEMDEAVLQELVEAGRTPQQAKAVLAALCDKVKESCTALVALQASAASQSGSSSDAVHLRGALSPSGQIVPDTLYELYYYHNQPAASTSTSTSTSSNTSTTYAITGRHLQKLLRLYQLHTQPDCRPPATASATLASSSDSSFPTFLRRVFCVLARYELLSGSSDGYQMAFPDAGFAWLRRNIGVTAECFASPLNCWNERFCSVARDTDRFFGSLGNFFHFTGVVPLAVGASSSGLASGSGSGSAPPHPLPRGGSFEANPPFVESIMNEMAARIESLLSSAGPDDPFSFSIIVPAWTGCQGLEAMTASRFLRPHAGYVLRLEKKRHSYRPGMQHRAEHAEQPSNVDTLVFVLQNDAGARKWPVTVALMEDLARTVNVNAN